MVSFRSDTPLCRGNRYYMGHFASAASVTRGALRGSATNIVTICSKKNRDDRDCLKKEFFEISKKRDRKRKFSNWKLEGFSISRKFSSRSRARGKVSRFFASSSLDFLETKFKNRIASNSVIDFRSLHRWENVAVALLNINKGGFHCQNNLVRILRGAGFHQVCMNPLRTNWHRPLSRFSPGNEKYCKSDIKRFPQKYRCNVEPEISFLFRKWDRTPDRSILPADYRSAKNFLFLLPFLWLKIDKGKLSVTVIEMSIVTFRVARLKTIRYLLISL